MSQDFLSQAEVDQLLRGVTREPTEAPSKFDHKCAVKFRNNTYHEIWMNDEVYEYVTENYQINIDYTEPLYHGTRLVTDEVLTMLNLKFR